MFKWKFDSLKEHNFKCFITNTYGFLDVHHLYGFNFILNETLNELFLPIKPIIGDYTKEELDLIEKRCLELHYEYGLGVPLLSNIHKDFHNIYGYGDNTPKQFYEFISYYKV